MTALPPWLLAYVAIGLALLGSIIWRAPGVVQAPTGGRVVQAIFVALLVSSFAAAWPLVVAWSYVRARRG